MRPTTECEPERETERLRVTVGDSVGVRGGVKVEVRELLPVRADGVRVEDAERDAVTLRDPDAVRDADGVTVRVMDDVGVGGSVTVPVEVVFREGVRLSVTERVFVFLERLREIVFGMLFDPVRDVVLVRGRVPVGIFDCELVAVRVGTSDRVGVSDNVTDFEVDTVEVGGIVGVGSRVALGLRVSVDEGVRLTVPV